MDVRKANLGWLSCARDTFGLTSQETVSLRHCSFESRDFRGIDVALLYRKSFFKVVQQTTYPLTYLDPTTGQKRYSRDLLVVEGFLNQHHIHLIVNHWPSQ